MKISKDLFTQANAAYLDQMYQRYLEDPESLEEPWRVFFTGFELGFDKVAPGGEAATPPGVSAGVYGLVNAYRTFGYLAAELNPIEENRTSHPFLDLARFGITSNDLSRDLGAGGFLGPKPKNAEDLVVKLKETYCGTFAAECMESIGSEHRAWLHERLEPNLGKPALGKAEKTMILEELIQAEVFEQFLQTKYLGQKRFSCEGAESLLPLLETVIREGAKLGVEEFTLGMAHRGRLNVLVHTMEKPYEDILCEFEGHQPHPDALGDGDVKYHMGFSRDRVMPEGQAVHLSLSPNPSHLELVDPVVEGMVRAKQEARNDKDRGQVVPIQIHGEAAFTGQGVVPEILLLSELPDYTTGGTIHVVVNNQLGFTATAQETRFTPFPTDIGRMIHAPIFHVNGDDPEAVYHAAKVAIEFRQKFKIDVLIDLVCYRRYGHNETDDPTFTSPLLYKKIQKRTTTAKLYSERLVQEGVVSEDDVQAIRDRFRSRLDEAQANAQAKDFIPSLQRFGGVWKGMRQAGEDWTAETKVSKEVLETIADRMTQFPEDFHVHRKLKRLYDTRAKMGRGEQPLDWGMAEALAFGSLLVEGFPVRLAGQDSQRGTFSHRHATLHDTENGTTYTPLQHVADDQAQFTVINTMLSELAVLGFEFGMSWTDPRRLVLWEAQFGDFANGAQTIIDQFICSSESKWERMSGLVMLLPHGYAGQGPEHSSARLERYLQLCAEGNMQVCNLTTPGQYFHSLRRQMLRDFRKPLVIMSPKKLLRYDRAISSIEDLSEGSFQTVLDDPNTQDPKAVKRVGFMSGKVFYTMQEAREQHGAEDLALVRLEQLYPFPEQELRSLLERYPNAEEFFWIQEEPANMGAWSFARHRLEKLLPQGAHLGYRGRSSAASTATGSPKKHAKEEAALIISVFGSAEPDGKSAAQGG